MKPDISSLLRIAQTFCLAAVVTLVAVVCVEVWSFDDPGEMIEMRSGVVCRGRDSEVYFRLQNTERRTITFTFTLTLYGQMEVHTNSWNVSIRPGSDFQYVLHTDAVDGLRKVNVQVHGEWKGDPIRDVTYFLLDNEPTQA